MDCHAPNGHEDACKKRGVVDFFPECSTGVRSFIIVISLKHTYTHPDKTTKRMLNQSHASAKTGLL